MDNKRKNIPPHLNPLTLPINIPNQANGEYNPNDLKKGQSTKCRGQASILPVVPLHYLVPAAPIMNITTAINGSRALTVLEILWFRIFPGFVRVDPLQLINRTTSRRHLHILPPTHLLLLPVLLLSPLPQLIRLPLAVKPVRFVVDSAAFELKLHKIQSLSKLQIWIKVALLLLVIKHRSHNAIVLKLLRDHCLPG